jgi:dienelactone hydrolase
MQGCHSLFVKVIGTIGLCIASASEPAWADQLVSLPTRSGVTQRFLLITPSQPKANAILFSGGDGVLDIDGMPDAPRIGASENNFLVRARRQFADQGLVVAVVDAPSDRKSTDGMQGGFRNSAEHVGDIDQVIAYLRKQNTLPVWLVGTSRGTESAANLAIHSTQQPHGLVLTSSITEKNAKGVALTDMALDKIKMPVLLVANTHDQCKVTPASGINRLAALLVNSSSVESKLVSGGDTPRAKPCQALSFHGFLGRETEVIKTITQFILSH